MVRCMFATSGLALLTVETFFWERPMVRSGLSVRSAAVATWCEIDPDTSPTNLFASKMHSGRFTPGKSPKPKLYDSKENEMKSVAPNSETKRREQEIMGQAYQVIGAIASEAGLFDHPDVQRALGYFSENRYRKDFLPFSLRPVKTVNGKLDAFEKQTSGDS